MKYIKVTLTPLLPPQSYEIVIQVAWTLQIVWGWRMGMWHKRRMVLISNRGLIIIIVIVMQTLPFPWQRWLLKVLPLGKYHGHSYRWLRVPQFMKIKAWDRERDRREGGREGGKGRYWWNEWSNCFILLLLLKHQLWPGACMRLQLPEQKWYSKFMQSCNSFSNHGQLLPRIRACVIEWLCTKPIRILGSDKVWKAVTRLQLWIRLVCPLNAHNWQW